MVGKSMSPTIPLPVTAPSASLRSRRLLHQVLLVAAVFVTAVFVFNKDLSVVPKAEPQNVVYQDGLSATLPETLADIEAPLEEPFILPAKYWGDDISSEDLLADVLPFQDTDANAQALSALGKAADDTYSLGPADLLSYRASLEAFIRSSFPEMIQTDLLLGLDVYLGDGTTEKRPAMDSKFVWQTAKEEIAADDGLNRLLSSWRNIGDGWQWQLLSDKQAASMVSKLLAGSKAETLWNTLPSGIHRADMLRYLLLLLKGGIYSDTDTRRLKGVDAWGRDAKLWRDGDGWMTAEERAEGLQAPSVIVGVEADVGDREDWNDWWPRPLQIIQWTIACAPSHPIMLSSLLRITESTARALDWTKAHREDIQRLVAAGKEDQARKLAEITHLDEPKAGGPVGVMGWTGPGVFTDAVLSYLRVKFGLKWTDLKNLREPLRVGDVVILPVTGFSPGIGMFGAKTAHNVQAMVEHGFAGSWKTDN